MDVRGPFCRHIGERLVGQPAEADGPRAVNAFPVRTVLGTRRMVQRVQ